MDAFKEVVTAILTAVVLGPWAVVAVVYRELSQVRRDQDVSKLRIATLEEQRVVDERRHESEQRDALEAFNSEREYLWRRIDSLNDQLNEQLLRFRGFRPSRNVERDQFPPGRIPPPANDSNDNDSDVG